MHAGFKNGKFDPSLAWQKKLDMKNLSTHNMNKNYKNWNSVDIDNNDNSSPNHGRMSP